MSNDVTSCAINGDAFTIFFGDATSIKGWELLVVTERAHAIYTAGQADAWCAERLALCNRDFISWAAGVKVRAADNKRKPMEAKAIVESSDQYRDHQRIIALAERMHRIATALVSALKFMTTESTNA